MSVSGETVNHILINQYVGWYRLSRYLETMARLAPLLYAS